MTGRIGVIVGVVTLLFAASGVAAFVALPTTDVSILKAVYCVALAGTATLLRSVREPPPTWRIIPTWIGGYVCGLTAYAFRPIGELRDAIVVAMTFLTFALPGVIALLIGFGPRRRTASWSRR